MKVHFTTPTKISLIDITSMGDSSKRGDDSTIGQYDSGLKYAIALLLRNNVGLSITVQGEPKFHENWDEDTTETYTFSTYTDSCGNTGKEKELIQVDCVNTPHGGAPMNPHDMREPSGEETWSVKTGFARALGYNWELWMALREIWSNMLDEGGELKALNYIPEPDGGTVMTLDFDEDSPFYEVWENRHLYINEELPDYIISSQVEAFKNTENYLRIYKQNILVYSDKTVPSRFAYNIKFGEIDERRILSNVYQVSTQIQSAIKNTRNEEFIRSIITTDFSTQEKEFLSDISVYGTSTDLMHDIATEVYEKHGVVQSYDWVMKLIRERKDCKISGKTINSVADHIWSYSTPVKIETKPEEIVETEESFADKIFKVYNFKLDVDVKKAQLSGSKVIADKFVNCLVVDESFDVSIDMAEFIVQYIDLTTSGNIVKNLSEYICNLIKK